MITIINRGKPENAKRKDERMYELKINQETLFYFLHNRDEGLAVRLARAASAAAQHEQLNNIAKGVGE